MQSETLKPCEMCGGRAVMRKDDDPGYPWYVTFDHLETCVMYAVPTDLFPSFATEAEAIAAWNNRTPAPPADSAGPPYASDNWDIQGYKSPAEEIDDMANVGRSLIEHIASVVSSDGPFKGWTPADDPAEIVSDMANWIAENRPSDWFAGDVDADGNELVTLPAHHIAAQDAKIARKDAALERCAKIVEQNLYHQHEKIEDVPRLLRAALNPETGHD